MDIFVTGSTGWVGFAVVQQLVKQGHAVRGLVRSSDRAARLAEAGATPVIGSLDDLDLLAGEARRSEGVIHTAFEHDWANVARSCEQDRAAILALGRPLASSGRRLLVTSGVALLAPGRFAREADAAPPVPPAFPRMSEAAAAELIADGVAAAVVRLPPSVHGRGDKGFVARLAGIAANAGFAAYVGDGANRWAAVHRDDAARLYAAAVTSEAEGPFHAVAEEGVAFRLIAEAIAARLGLPARSIAADAAGAHFGWLAPFAAMDMAASAACTAALLDWAPEGPTLLADITQTLHIEEGDRS